MLTDNSLFSAILPGVGTVAAFAAAVFAYLSWRLIQEQLVRADRQIQLALEQIGLARNEVALVIRDLEITTKQADAADRERTRAPRLELSFAHGRRSLYLRGGGGRTEPQRIRLAWRCSNLGNKEALGYLIFLFFPNAFRFAREYTAAGVELPQASSREYRRRSDAPHELPGYFASAVEFDGQLLPGLHGDAGIAWILAPRGRYFIYYQVRTGRYTFPQDAYGRLIVYIGDQSDGADVPIDLESTSASALEGRLPKLAESEPVTQK